MQYTIHEAQLAYETYGTITVCDGDTCTASVYDDDEDARINWCITRISYV